jgi:diguanylate cyclase (GGDEF)-like protein
MAARVEQLPAFAQYAIAGALILSLFVFDVITGFEAAFSIFYALPVSMIAWHCSWPAARLTALVCGIAWLFADMMAGHVYVQPALQYWNCIARTGFFLIMASTISMLRRAVDEEQRLARTDPLTGAANSRSFLETAAYEVSRQKRYRRPLSVAFLDCDNFKQINDRLGHAAGDILLEKIANALQKELREVDVVARLGGDEFAMLLPETDADAASGVSTKLLASLQACTTEYGVTFSIGMITFLEPAKDTDELLRIADDAMYEAKRSGKNAVCQHVIGADLPKAANV